MWYVFNVIKYRIYKTHGVAETNPKSSSSLHSRCFFTDRSCGQVEWWRAGEEILLGTVCGGSRVPGIKFRA